MARTIPYRGKQGKEHGQWEFLQRSEMPSELMLLHSSGNDEAIARDMHLEAMNQDKQECTNIVANMGEDEYFKMWDRIDKRGFFRNGEPTVQALRHSRKVAPNMCSAWEGKPHRSPEDEAYDRAWREAREREELDKRSDEMISNYSDLEMMRGTAERVREQMEQRRLNDNERFQKAQILAKRVAKAEDFCIMDEIRLTYMFEKMFKGREVIPYTLIEEAIDYVKDKKKDFDPSAS